MAKNFSISTLILLLSIATLWAQPDNNKEVSEIEQQIDIGNACYDMGDHENAMDAYLNAMALNEKDKEQKNANRQSIEQNIRKEVQLLINISNIYGQLYNADKQIELLSQAIKVMEENPSVDFKQDKYSAFGNLGIAYVNIRQNDKAVPLLEKAYTLATAAEDPECMTLYLCLFADLSVQSDDYQQALNYGKQALQLAEKSNLTGMICTAEYVLMKSYLYVKDYKTALHYAESMLAKTSEHEWLRLQDIYINMAMIYAAMGNIEQSHEYLIEYQQLMLNISDDNLHNALQEMEVKYNVQQKEQQHQQELEHHQRTRNFYITGLSIAGLLLALLIYIIRLRTRRNRELSDMNATKDKFFNIISHDLKNPAIAQRNAIQRLVEYSGEWDATALLNFYYELLKSSNSQVELLNNLLNWASVQTGRMPYQPRNFDLVAALHNDITMTKFKADLKNITLETQLPETAIVTGDENMLTTIIRNLITNAVKFTPTSGTVALNIAPIRSTGDPCGRPPSPSHTISISDTGIGISPEQQQNLFHLAKRHQAKTDTASEQGSGLGLIVCKELLEKHGSKLHIESEERKGSRFWFEI